MYIVIENTSNAKSALIVKAGKAYPNSMLGDIALELAEGVSAIQIQDLSRFQKSDEYSSNFFGLVAFTSEGYLG